MECISCDLTSICKIYEFINLQRAHADMSVTNCRTKRQEADVPALPAAKETIKTEPVPRTAESIASVSEKIRQLSAQPVVDSIFTNCPECDQDVHVLNVVKCKDCKTQLCAGCAIEDSATKKMYCEPCWDKL